MRVTLTVTGGPHRGKEFSFDRYDFFIVGRASNAHFRLAREDPSLGRHHFLVEVCPPDQCRVVDMASRNGTFVNGTKVEAADLGDGDVIEAGRTALTVRVSPSPGPGPSAPLPAAAPSAPLLPGDGLGDAVGGEGPRYRIEGPIATGGMGVVYQARDRAEGEDVAVKVIHPALAGSHEPVVRFLREARILRNLDHPGIVRFRDIGYADRRLYLVMDLVPGCNAYQLMQAHGGRLPTGLAARLGCQMLDALEYAHGRNVVHRDIKPSNLLVTGGGGSARALLADFGVARLYQATSLAGLSLTQNRPVGTVPFMAPEQFDDIHTPSPLADQYSAAATLYYLLSGHYPYDFPEKARPWDMIKVILEAKAPVPLAGRAGGVPDGLCAVVEKGLRRRPEGRFADVAEMRRALEPHAG